MNIILDWVFVGIFKMGIPGAAIATGISQIVGGIIPLIYFSFPNSSLFITLAAELLALGVSVYFIIKLQSKYKY